MGQNYLNGANSLHFNSKLAATGWNSKKLMKKLKTRTSLALFFLE